MALSCGIVGLPNVGKSTLFNALTASGIAAENYPFCTIEPNVGIVTVPDKRLDELSKIVNPQKIQAAIVEFVDIAGLVAGASKGEGLGNQFLANIRKTAAIIHVVRCFDDKNIMHINNQVSPLDDVITINTELALADIATIEKTLLKENKKAKAQDKTAQKLVKLLETVLAKLNQGIMLRNLGLDQEELDLLKPLCLLTIKPVLYVANVHENGFKQNHYLDQLITHAQTENSSVVPICAAIEAEIATLDLNDRLEFLADMHMTEPGLDRLIHAAYRLLNLHTYFTAGVKEVRAWTIPINATAPKAAGVIHSDFEHGFIRAEVISYNDFITYQGEHAAKEAGKMRLEGKEYIVKDGDVMHFRFAV